MSISGTNRRLAWSYGIATAGVVLTGLSPWWLTPLIGDTPPMRLMLVLVVIGAAWLGGAGPGLFATAMGLGALVATNDRPGEWQVLAIRLMRFGSLALLINLLFAGVHVQRRRAEQKERAFLRSEGRYRRLIEAAAEGIWAIGKDGRTTYANPRLGEILGVPATELVGRPLADFLVDPVGTPGNWTESPGQPHAWHEVRLRRRDGAIRDAVVTVRPIGPDDDSGTGRPGQRPENCADGGLLLMVTDVTSLRRAERALREKESLLRSFYESSSTAMGVVELAGDDARIISANAPTDRLFGRRPGEVEGKTARELGMPPDRLAAWLDRIRRCRDTGRPVRFEERGAWPAGPEWVATTLSAMDSPGTGDDLCSFLIEDITERKRTEGDLCVAKEIAEAASRAKDRFLAVLSHELRTPLTPVMIAVSSLIESGPDPALLPDLEMIRRNIELESRLIDDLLDLSRIARGRLRLEIEIADMHQALRRAVEICRDETFVAGLDVFTELTARDYHVAADHARLMQIAWNLVRNAAKFTPPGGQLIIRTSNLSLTSNGDAGPDRTPAEGGPGHLVVEFADTGIGIAPDVLPRIFDAFEQGHHDLRGRSRGLGLGLAICRSLAEAMGGRLTASSPGAGHGSTFRLEIATVPAPAPASAPAPGATGPPPGDPSGPPREPNLRVLLVEDNEDTLRFLATVLRRRGHDVVTADTIAAARQAVARAERPFELLLSDIELPDGTGLELMRDLRDRGDIPGIAMSGFGAEEDIELSRAAGFLDHLIKPIDPARLDAAIRRAAGAARTGGSNGEDGSSDSSDRKPSSGAFPVVSMREP